MYPRGAATSVPHPEPSLNEPTLLLLKGILLRPRTAGDNALLIRIFPFIPFVLTKIQPSSILTDKTYTFVFSHYSEIQPKYLFYNVLFSRYYLGLAVARDFAA